MDKSKVDSSSQSLSRDMAAASEKTWSPDDALYAMTLNITESRSSTWGMLRPILKSFRAYDLSNDKFTLGKSEESDCLIGPGMFPNNGLLRYISKKHFEIAKAANSSPVIIDHSTAGTFINKRRLQKLQPTQLKNNDLISIGTDKINVFVYKSFHDDDDDGFLPENLQQRYEVSRRLGKGSFGEVRMVFDKNTYRPYAIKKVKKTGQYASTETDILRDIHHPFIISFNEAVETVDAYYIVMEYMDDGDLQDLIRKERLTEIHAKYIFLQILTALEYLHNLRIIHRDLKPSNILKKTGVEDLIFKIADFGLGKILDEESKTDTICGTEAFMAPELFIEESYDFKVDVWSMGVILYYMLSSELPFTANDNGIITDILFGNLKRKIANLKDVSYEAKELIENTLKVLPGKRLSVEQIQEDPWIAKDKSVQEKVRRIVDDN